MKFEHRDSFKHKEHFSDASLPTDDTVMDLRRGERGHGGVLGGLRAPDPYAGDGDGDQKHYEHRAGHGEEQIREQECGDPHRRDEQRATPPELVGEPCTTLLPNSATR
ncbi:MAG: hypothetical protein ACRDTH_15085 [Pseudonocardiaceae bacterium]